MVNFIVTPVKKSELLVGNSLIDRTIRSAVDANREKLAGREYGIAIGLDWGVRKKLCYILVAENVRGG